MSGVLLISIVYPPNTGGVETHLFDLTKSLSERGWRVSVLTYKPITTKQIANFHERKGKVQVYRLPWISGLFYKLVDKPLLEFLYLIPGLFLAAPLLLLFSREKLEVIHGQGLIGGAVSVFWGRIFSKRVVISIHNVYEFPARGFYRKFAKWIFGGADYILGLSSKAASEIKSLGVSKNKIGTFTYWVDLNRFKILDDKSQIKKKLGWDEKFVVLFVGRLVPEKGVLELLQAVKIWNKNITLAIAGSGPLEKIINNQKSIIKNLTYLGRIDNNNLPLYYNAADLVIVPSTHEEGFGRVILESLACGTPVIGAKRGAIPEAMDETVGVFIDVRPMSIKNTVESLYNNPSKLKNLAKNCRNFALKNYSQNNFRVIFDSYAK